MSQARAPPETPGLPRGLGDLGTANLFAVQVSTANPVRGSRFDLSGLLIVSKGGCLTTATLLCSIKSSSMLNKNVDKKRHDH